MDALTGPGGIFAAAKDVHWGVHADELTVRWHGIRKPISGSPAHGLVLSNADIWLYLDIVHPTWPVEVHRQ